MSDVSSRLPAAERFEHLRQEAAGLEIVSDAPLLSGEALILVNDQITATDPPEGFLRDCELAIRKRNYYLVTCALEMNESGSRVVQYFLDSYLRSGLMHQRKPDDVLTATIVLKEVTVNPERLFTDALVIPGGTSHEDDLIAGFLGVMYGICGITQASPGLLERVTEQHIEFFRRAIGADLGVYGADRRVLHTFATCFDIDSEEYYQSTQRLDPRVRYGFCTALLLAHYTRKDCTL